MKNQIKLSLLILSIFAQTACSSLSTTSNVEDDFSDLELTEEAPQKSNLQADAVAALKSQDKSKIEGQIAVVDGQIGAIDKKIAQAQARLNHYQFMTTPAKDSLVGSTQSEIIALEGQKNSLISRRTQLQTELNAQ